MRTLAIKFAPITMVAESSIVTFQNYTVSVKSESSQHDTVRTLKVSLVVTTEGVKNSTDSFDEQKYINRHTRDHASCAVARDNLRTHVALTKVVVTINDVRPGDVAVDVVFVVIEMASLDAGMDAKKKNERSDKARSLSHATKKQTVQGGLGLSMMIIQKNTDRLAHFL